MIHFTQVDGLPAHSAVTDPISVIPAQAGILLLWHDYKTDTSDRPACAGMTYKKRGLL